jgi:hypothetical protein
MNKILKELTVRQLRLLFSVQLLHRPMLYDVNGQPSDWTSLQSSITKMQRAKLAIDQDWTKRIPPIGSKKSCGPSQQWVRAPIIWILEIQPRLQTKKKTTAIKDNAPTVVA